MRMMKSNTSPQAFDNPSSLAKCLTFSEGCMPVLLHTSIDICRTLGIQVAGAPIRQAQAPCAFHILEDAFDSFSIDRSKVR